MKTLKLISFGLGLWIKGMCAIFIVQLLFHTADFAEIGKIKLMELGRQCPQTDVKDN